MNGIGKEEDADLDIEDEQGRASDDIVDERTRGGPYVPAATEYYNDNEQVSVEGFRSSCENNESNEK